MSVTSRRKFAIGVAAGIAATIFAIPLTRLNAQGNDMADNLKDAVIASDVKAVAHALQAGAPVDARDNANRTALLVATRNNSVDVARALIDAGADVNAKDNIRDTPFLYASAEGRNEIFKLIIATGRAKLDDTNRYGGMALIPAAHHGHPETVRMLIKAGVQLNHVNKLGWTALIEAVILGDGGPVYQEIVGDLLAAGADWKIADQDGVTPLEHARRRNFVEIAAQIAAKSGD